MKKIMAVISLIAYIICWTLVILNIFQNEHLEAIFWLLMIWRVEDQRTK